MWQTGKNARGLLVGKLRTATTRDPLYSRTLCFNRLLQGAPIVRSNRLNCRWDIWDNQNQAWIPTGVPCNPTNNAWNHVTIQVQRTDQNQLLFQSITLNGKTSVINHTENPSSSNWHGITINYQQDGNRSQQAYSVWLDNLTFSYW